MIHTFLNKKFSTFIFLILTIGCSASAQEGFIYSCSKPGTVALTFDDGPSGLTMGLLDILKEKNIKVTFFVLGVSLGTSIRQDTLKSAYQAGHQIGLHTNTHPHLNTLSQTDQMTEMHIVEDLVFKTLNLAPAYMRPPFGECDDKCITTMRSLNYTIVTWNTDSNDWRLKTEKPEEQNTGIISNVVTPISKGDVKKDSFVVLLHDTDTYSVGAAGKIIDAITQKGFQFVTIAECHGNNPPPYKGISTKGDSTLKNPSSSSSSKSSSPSTSSSTTTSSPSPSPSATVYNESLFNVSTLWNMTNISPLIGLNGTTNVKNPTSTIDPGTSTLSVTIPSNSASELSSSTATRLNSVFFIRVLGFAIIVGLKFS
ncbi:hypothetical protein G9A89_020247 [Geosiphon pyriformis]|nr:hypothetical protein G9A89_020247 [Geosiphon pyriformis]